MKNEKLRKEIKSREIKLLLNKYKSVGVCADITLLATDSS